jgi:hypothetical protein
MQGTYRLKIGNMIYEYKNIITNSGRLGILNALSGQRQGWASSIVAGVGGTPEDISNTSLEFSYSGGDINATIIDPINEKLYFKSSLPLQDEFTIYELGCYSSNTLSTQSSESGGGNLLMIFTSNISWTDTDGTHTYDTDNNRIGENSVNYIMAGSGTASGYSTYISDLSFIPNNAVFKLAYFTEEIAELALRFKIDDDNYFEYTGWTTSDGYHIDSILKSDFTSTGSPTWDNIQQLEIAVEATPSGGVVSLDGLRYELPLSEESHLLSRVVLNTPQEKLPGVPLDIEYLLEL